DGGPLRRAGARRPGRGDGTGERPRAGPHAGRRAFDTRRASRARFAYPLTGALHAAPVGEEADDYCRTLPLEQVCCAAELPLMVSGRAATPSAGVSGSAGSVGSVGSSGASGSCTTTPSLAVFSCVT